MRKYLTYWAINIQNTVAYRGQMMVWLASNLVTLTIFVSIWLSAKYLQTNPGGYTQNQLVTYYLLGLFLQWIVGWFPFSWLKEEIRNGGIIGTTFTKPVSFFWKNFFIELGWHTVSLWVGFAATILAGFSLFPYLSFSFNLINTFMALLAVVIAIFITYTLSVCLALLAFWFTHIDTLEGLFWITRSIFGGEGIPIALFPAGIFTVLKFLPYRYMYSFPLEVILGKLDYPEVVNGISVGIVWILILVVIYKILWRQGNRVYTSAGV